MTPQPDTYTKNLELELGRTKRRAADAERRAEQAEAVVAEIRRLVGLYEMSYSDAEAVEDRS